MRQRLHAPFPRDGVIHISVHRVHTRVAAARAAAYLADPPRHAVAAAASPLADVLREARAVLGLQRQIVGPTRYLSGDPAFTADAPTPSASAEPAPVVPPPMGETAEARPPGESATEPAHPADGPRPAPAAPLADAPSSAPASATPDPTDDVPDLFGALPDPSQDEALSPYDRIEALIPAGHPLHDMTSLDEVYAWLAETELVPIDKERINPVLGTGDPHADLMVIGEAPGADEDRQGEPFVGRSGQLLDKILEAVLFQRPEVYITNILKSRPPNNRDPLPEEVEAHIPILYKQIALVRPRMLLAVGKSAGNGLLGKKSSLASLRGKFNDFYGLPMMVTYHPAALLRNPQWKRPTWEDVKLLRTRYDQLTDG